MSNKVKRAVRLRDEYKCQKCGMLNDQCVAETGKSLNVHRRIPGCKYSLEHCITLCHRCHKHAHKVGEFIDDPIGPVEMDQSTKRFPLQIPKPWHDFARKMASKRKQPMLWYILALLAEDAEEQGEEHPALPWEDGE